MTRPTRGGVGSTYTLWPHVSLIMEPQPRVLGVRPQPTKLEAQPQGPQDPSPPSLRSAYPNH